MVYYTGGSRGFAQGYGPGADGGAAHKKHDTLPPGITEEQLNDLFGELFGKFGLIPEDQSVLPEQSPDAIDGAENGEQQVTHRHSIPPVSAGVISDRIDDEPPQKFEYMLLCILPNNGGHLIIGNDTPCGSMQMYFPSEATAKQHALNDMPNRDPGTEYHITKRVARTVVPESRIMWM